MSEAVNGEAVTRIADLAKSAAGADILSVSVTGVGLPSSFPVLFDKRANGVGIKDLKAHAETWRTAPERKKGTAKLATLDSFIDLTNRHKDANSVIFAQATWPNPSLTAVLNYNAGGADGAARFGDHRFVYSFPITDEFKAWADHDSAPMSQGEFASFIEERVFELADAMPEELDSFEKLLRTQFASPSRMVELSRGLQVHVASGVKSGITLNSGEAEIQFVEEHRDTNGEKLTVPGLFMISLPAFIGGVPVRIPVRLRYRIKSGAIAWFYQMYRWKEFLRERVVADLQLARLETELATFEGSPE
ncbi:DUF2303 family protein [Bradyrhizobium sp. BRP22]|uniref:DUF2303 family protein n=1 Tax=Bradyrhizobium sp. BRP22 TaxID=2793821 RepID=UPI001CD48DFC|nr:DUF2303 family protein [Bradyrhizobium sp. BRP22]MCA1458050.1 DUF2303 family protein [Bradyrhizobium sp. BRP22]